jgi:hypothetical protein
MVCATVEAFFTTPFLKKGRIIETLKSFENCAPPVSRQPAKVAQRMQPTKVYNACSRRH